MNWELALSVLAIVVTICGTSVGAVWILTTRMSNDRNELQQQFTRDRNELTQAITSMNNALLTRIQMAEESLEAKIINIAQQSERRALEIERDLAQFKTYCERQFLSKDTFQTVMNAQSSERSAMKNEIIDRFNRLEKRIDEEARGRDR